MPSWRLHPGNIPTLQAACIRAIRQNDRLIDALLLQGFGSDQILPSHILESILEEEDGCDDSDDGSSHEEGGQEGVSACTCGICQNKTGKVLKLNVGEKSADPPTADTTPEPSCPCRDIRCSSGFFPTAAVFVNEHQAVLLDGASGCLKRCIVTFPSPDSIGNASESIHYSNIETIQEAYHRRYGGVLGSDSFVLREDGAAVGVVSGDLCMFPLRKHYQNIPQNNYAHDMGRIPLRFRNLFPKGKYSSISLPRIMRMEDAGGDQGKSGDEGINNNNKGNNIGESHVFCLAFLSVNARKANNCIRDKLFDLRRIYLKTGYAAQVDEDQTDLHEQYGGMADAIGGPRRSTTKVAWWKKLPQDMKVESFLQIDKENVLLLVQTRQSPSAKREHILFRGRIGADERGAPTVAWSRETLIPRHAAAATMEQFSAVSSASRKFQCVSGRDISADGACPFYIHSVDDGATDTWSQAGHLVHGKNGGREGMPQVIAVSPSGRVFSFGYDKEQCRSAETKRLMGKKAISWPSLQIYEWC